MQKAQTEKTSEVQDNTSCVPASRARATWKGKALIMTVGSFCLQNKKHLNLSVKFYKDHSQQKDQTFTHTQEKVT